MEAESSREDGSKWVRERERQLDAGVLVSPSLNNGWKIENSVLTIIPGPSGYAEDLLQFQHRFGIQFRNQNLLRSALLNHSFLNSKLGNWKNQKRLSKTVLQQYRESSIRVSNRAFEFLGDSVLGMAASSFVFQAFPMHTEGEPH